MIPCYSGLYRKNPPASNGGKSEYLSASLLITLPEQLENNADIKKYSPCTGFLTKKLVKSNDDKSSKCSQCYPDISESQSFPCFKYECPI